MEGKILCDKCSEGVYGDCTECKKPIGAADEFIEMLDAVFHVGCLKCKECGVVLKNNDDYAVRNGFPICKQCNKTRHATCLKCRKEISDLNSMLMIGKFLLTFHPECYKCDKCSQMIPPKDKFKVHQNSLFHESCA